MKDSTMKPTSVPNNGGQVQPLPKCTYNNPEPMGNTKKYTPGKCPAYTYPGSNVSGKGNFRDDAK